MKIIKDETQLTVKLESELFKQVKRRALDSGMNLKQWVSQAFIEKILRENKVK